MATVNKTTILADGTVSTKCPTCNGCGKKNITVVMYSQPSIVNITCVNCHGKGVQTRDDMIDGFVWCKCGEFNICTVRKID